MSEVFVYIYDISKGMANQLSQSILGKKVPGIWHTGIVVYDKEFYFGSNGIESCSPSGTLLGQPNDRVKLGVTLKIEEELYLHLKKLSLNIFNGSKYDLLGHNCNTFSNELGIWLTGQGIPEYITNLPREILDTPFGKMLRPFIEQFKPVVSTDYKSVTAYNSKITSNSPSIKPIYFEESFGLQVDDILSGNILILENDHVNILKNMVYSIKDNSQFFISEETIDLIKLTNTKASTRVEMKIALFDILRLFIMKEIECVVELFLDPIVWMRAVFLDISDENLNNSKCKFFCNLVGKHFEIISTNTEMLKMISDFGQHCLQCKSTIEVASSLIHNLVINVSALDENVMLEISSCLIHILANNDIMEKDITKENIVGSVYYLVKNSQLVKDLAKAQDIDKRIRRETVYCQLLHNELQ